MLWARRHAASKDVRWAACCERAETELLAELPDRIRPDRQAHILFIQAIYEWQRYTERYSPEKAHTTITIFVVKFEYKNYVTSYKYVAMIFRSLLFRSVGQTQL